MRTHRYQRSRGKGRRRRRYGRGRVGVNLLGVFDRFKDELRRGRVISRFAPYFGSIGRALGSAARLAGYGCMRGRGDPPVAYGGISMETSSSVPRF